MNKVFYLFIFMIVFSACTKEVQVYDSPANDQLELPLLLNLNHKSIVLDITTSTMKYTVEEASYTDFEVFVEFKEKTRVIFEGQEWTNNSIHNLGAIEVNKPYNIEFISNNEQQIFQLVFTNLSLVQIISHDKIINEPKSMARVLIFENKDGLIPVSTLIGIEKRGASSLGNPKNSYGFKALNSFNIKDVKTANFFDMGYSSTWILDAIYIDKSKMRNRTCFEIWESMNSLSSSIHYAVDFKYVEVYLNYESYGVYTFNENLNYETLELNSSSLLYVGKDNKPETKFTDLPKSSPSSSFWGAWEQKYPDPSNQIDWSHFYSFCKLVVEKSNEEFISDMPLDADLELLVDYYLFVNLIQGYDNTGKNWFFLKKDASHKMTVIPWDLDSSFGRDHRGVEVWHEGIATNGLFMKLIALNPDNYKQKLKDRWLELRQNQFSYSSVMTRIDANMEVLNASDVIEVENRVWNQNVDLLSERAFISSWLTQRLSYLDDYFDNL